MARIAENVPSLREIVAGWRAAGETVALVPTMGALHEGHLALVSQAKREADRVVVSIFVNPAQFGPNEDYARYPRTFVEDCVKLDSVGTDLVFAPSAEEIYPAGFATKVVLDGPAVAGLEDRFRPIHFIGVATVVAKLLIQVMPDIAIFGAKDYQQLMVITRMAKDLDLPVRIVGGETVREEDGLALSSRNRYLTAQDRAKAPALYRAMTACAAAIRGGAPIDAALAHARDAATAAGFDLDYLEARNAETLAPLSGSAGEPIRLLAAGKLGTTRLIDNIAV